MTRASSCDTVHEAEDPELFIRPAGETASYLPKSVSAYGKRRVRAVKQFQESRSDSQGKFPGPSCARNRSAESMKRRTEIAAHSPPVKGRTILTSMRWKPHGVSTNCCKLETWQCSADQAMCRSVHSRLPAYSWGVTPPRLSRRRHQGA